MPAYYNEIDPYAGCREGDRMIPGSHVEPDPDLVLLARLIWAMEPEHDASGAKAALGRLALKLLVLAQIAPRSTEEALPPTLFLPSDW